MVIEVHSVDAVYGCEIIYQLAIHEAGNEFPKLFSYIGQTITIEETCYDLCRFFCSFFIQMDWIKLCLCMDWFATHAI